ncbi:DNA/RNA non-specific endonuclease [Acidovorax sp. sic0104]|uniref:DNA/RNA non-specific endonuclease n=1 Tax=Acidovorax sp. sic0104 TaxID=2854784 RepID=UPI001C47BC0B|nr:DNA/RNA non-specific endonuclease [Acidovorax sp. sic0104]MBV7542712.1 DNA/RNA non-specific endonuclease [Acidovorax sp. sic0104]
MNEGRPVGIPLPPSPYQWVPNQWVGREVGYLVPGHWIDTGNAPERGVLVDAQASSNAFYTDRIADASNPFAAVSYTLGRAANNAGYDIANGVAGLYNLATDAQTRANLIVAGVNTIAHPFDTGTALYGAGAKYVSNTSIGQMGEDALRFGLGGLATAGIGKGATAVGGLAVDGTAAAGRWIAPALGDAIESQIARTGGLAYMVEPGMSAGGATVVRGGDAIAVTANVGRNSVTWIVESEGALQSASGTLRDTFSNAARTTAEREAQSFVGASGIAGDQGGHLVGHRFVLNQGEINMFPQEASFNNSAFRTLENDYARYTRQGYQVDFNHTLENFSSSGRPGSLSYTFDVTDSAGNLIDSASGRFFNQAGQNYTRRAW